MYSRPLFFWRPKTLPQAGPPFTPFPSFSLSKFPFSAHTHRALGQSRKCVSQGLLLLCVCVEKAAASRTYGTPGEWRQATTQEGRRGDSPTRICASGGGNYPTKKTVESPTHFGPSLTLCLPRFPSFAQSKNQSPGHRRYVPTCLSAAPSFTTSFTSRETHVRPTTHTLCIIKALLRAMCTTHVCVQ